MHEPDGQELAVQIELPEELEQRDQRDLERHDEQRDAHDEEHVAAREAHEREGISRERRDRDREQGRRQRHDEAVQERRVHARVEHLGVVAEREALLERMEDRRPPAARRGVVRAPDRRHEQPECRDHPEEADPEEHDLDEPVRLPDLDAHPPSAAEHARAYGWRLGAHRACLLGSELANLVDHRWDHGDHQQHDHGRRTAAVAELEELDEDPVPDHVGVEVAAGHDVDDVEDLQHEHDLDDQHRDHGRPDRRHQHPEEDLPLGRPVDPGRLDDLLRHALDRGRQQDHREPGLEPEHDDHQQERVQVELVLLDPRDRVEAESR